MIEELATYLDAQSTRFTFSTTGNLFVNYLPDTPATAAALLETGGLPPTRRFAGVPAWENARVQLVCRSSSSTKARANADAAWGILEGIANTTLSGSTYLRVSAVQSVFLIDRNPAGQTEYGANFDVQRRR